MRMLAIVLCLVIATGVYADVEHSPLDAVKIGERAHVVAKLTDDKGIQNARLYFKSNLSNKFSFLDLEMTNQSLFTQLPAPGPSMVNIEYFFVVKYRNGELEQSSVYLVKVDNEWSEGTKKAYADAIRINSELSEDEDSELSGFVDNIRFAYQASKLLNQSGFATSFASYSNYSVVSSSAVSTSSSTTAATTTTSAASSSGMGVLGWTAVGAGVVAGGAAIAKEADDAIEDQTCSLSTGIEASGSSYSFTAKSGWWVSNGQITTATWTSEEGTISCTSQVSEAYNVGCDAIESSLQSQCNASSTADVTCRVLSAKPSYMNCG